MKNNLGRYLSGRRSFLRTAAALGLGATGAALVSPITSLTALADEHETSFVGRRGSDFTLKDDEFRFCWHEQLLPALQLSFHDRRCAQ